jgi:hypothetical protein
MVQPRASDCSLCMIIRYVFAGDFDNLYDGVWGIHGHLEKGKRRKQCRCTKK